MKSMKLCGFQTLFIYVLEEIELAMVSDVNQKNEIFQQNGDSTLSSSTTVPTQTENGAGIFRVGLTRTEASTDTKLNSLFTKYNTDGDDVISQNEYNTYSTDTQEVKQSDVTSSSGKRVAVGGVYTVQKGDTLSKIAQDFGVSVLTLYEENKSVIGNDANKIQIGQQLQIFKSTKASENSDTKSSVGNDDSIKPSEEFLNLQAEAFEKIKKMAAGLGIDLSDIKSLDELKAKMKSLPPEAKEQIYNTLMDKFIDMSQVDKELVALEIDEIAEKLGISKEEWAKASPDEKGKILSEAYNKHLTVDMDENNENSAYNKELERLKTEGPTEREKQLYKNIDFNNLSEADYKNLAKAAVLQKHQATAAAIATSKLSNGENQNYIITANAFMLSMLNDSNISNSFSLITGMTGGFSEKEVESFYNTYAKTYTHTDETDTSFEALALAQAMEHADEESIQTLYQNNEQIADRLNDAAKQVILTTNDDTRKEMLSGIVEKSSEIISGASNGGNTKVDNRGNSDGGYTGSQSLAITNPIQNSSQTNYIANLRQASMEYQEQVLTSSNAIPKEYENEFKTVKEYLDFKGTGLTMAEYQKIKATVKSNFTSSMNKIIGDYSNIPDKFKPRILAFFDTMDNNTCGELYIGANDKVRAFMDKYNYMSDEKLLTFVETHPAMINDAPKNVKMQIDQIRQQENMA